MSLIKMNIPNTLLCAFLFLISNVIVINGAILPTVDIQGSVEKVTSTKSRQNKGIFVVSYSIKLKKHKLFENFASVLLYDNLKSYFPSIRVQQQQPQHYLRQLSAT